MANHPQNGDLPAYPSTNEEEYLAALTMQAGATYVDDGGNHPKNGDLPPYPTTNVEEYLAYLVQAGLGKVTKGYMYNGNFYEDLAHTKLITPKEGSIYYDVNENKMYVYLNAQYHAISSSQVGRFLSSWNAQTGLPTTNPGTVPYTYHTGDYYMITNVGTTNYKPSGSTYTGTASTTTETGNISDNDFYFYDGTIWFLLKNSHPEIPAVVQSTGTSTTSVMSQNATTEAISAAQTIRVLTEADYDYTYGTTHGVALWRLQSGLYYANGVTTWSYKNSFLGNFGSGLIQIKRRSDNITTWIIGLDIEGVNATPRKIIKAQLVECRKDLGTLLIDDSGVVDSLTSTNSEVPLSAKQGKVLKDLIDSLVISGAGAPTTSTVGTVGKLYQDTTNGELYQCTAVSGSTYTWTKVGSPTIVQSTGTSTTDVMSQKASTELIFKPNTQPSSNVLKIGSISNRSSSDSIAIGWGGNGPSSQDSISIGNALCYGSDSIAIGAQGAYSSGSYSIFIGRGDRGSSMKAGVNSVAIGGLYPSAAGSMCVALGSNARTIDNVNGATAIGYMSRVGKAGTVGIGAYSGNNDASQDVAGTVYFNSRETAYGYNNSNYRLLTGLYDGQNAHDAATKGQLDTKQNLLSLYKEETVDTVETGYEEHSKNATISIANAEGETNWNSTISVYRGTITQREEGEQITDRSANIGFELYDETTGKEAIFNAQVYSDTTGEEYSSVDFTADTATFNSQQLATFFIGDDAPTTTTEGNIGTFCFYNGSLYVCTAVDKTDPENIEYTWEQVTA